MVVLIDEYTTDSMIRKIIIYNTLDFSIYSELELSQCCGLYTQIFDGYESH